MLNTETEQKPGFVTVGGIAETRTMAVIEDTDWDITTYRQAHESDEHWQLKEEFMEAHKSIIPEDRLVCLAQVYQNVELLGCRYSDEIMEQVAELGRDINNSYRESKKNKLQRTFVKASDAAESRAKGKKTTRYASELPLDNRKDDDLSKRGTRNTTHRDNSNSDNNSNGDENSNGDNNSNGDENSNGDDNSNGDKSVRKKKKIITKRTPDGVVEATTTTTNTPVEDKDNNPITNIGPGPINMKLLATIQKYQKATEQSVKQQQQQQQQQKIQQQNPPSSQTGKSLNAKIQFMKQQPQQQPQPQPQPPYQNPSSSQTGRKLNAKMQFVKQEQPNPNPASSQELQGMTQASSNTPRLPGSDRCALTEPTTEYRESLHPLSKMIIVQRDYLQEPAIGALRCSASLSSVPLKLEWNTKERMCSAWVNRFLVATATGIGKKETMRAVATKTLEELIKHCYTIRVLKRHESDDCVTMDEVSNEGESYSMNMNNNESEIINESESSSNKGTKKKKKQNSPSLDTPLDENSLGNKLLRMMGWTGGGLGKEGKGITEPIRPVQIFGRDGLGHEARVKSNTTAAPGIPNDGVGRGMYGGGGGALIPGRGGALIPGGGGGLGVSGGVPTATSVHFQKKIKAVIQEFINNPVAEDISFSNEFTSDQRKMIHQLAQKRQLKSRSYGVAPNRYLVVSRKFSPKQLLQTLLRNGPTDKYEVIPPTTLCND
ncbi:hypothetical protein Pcinc_005252 [Petrolisthes cinctipes]|uniref:NF-kappa-B-repressing factor n=1 Tax=Petrolisthes cinctipes TaxID=88211 RepID=A0AAE1L0R6_PETCI|nr:hypothetical protein Pcinc_005252 [Petrolisthes cinctipes]